MNTRIITREIRILAGPSGELHNFSDVRQLKPMYCCDRLQNSISHAGQRGLATLVERTPRQFIFYLQSRAVAFGEERRLRVEPMDIKVNIDFTVGIRFCPWCGKRLQDLATAAPRQFTELAEQHGEFVPKT